MYQIDLIGSEQDLEKMLGIIYHAGFIKARVSFNGLLQILKQPENLFEFSKEIKQFYKHFWDIGEECWNTTLENITQEEYIKQFFEASEYLSYYDENKNLPIKKWKIAIENINACLHHKDLQYYTKSDCAKCNKGIFPVHQFIFEKQTIGICANCGNIEKSMGSFQNNTRRIRIATNQAVREFQKTTYREWYQYFTLMEKTEASLIVNKIINASNGKFGPPHLDKTGTLTKIALRTLSNKKLLENEKLVLKAYLHNYVEVILGPSLMMNKNIVIINQVLEKVNAPQEKDKYERNLEQQEKRIKEIHKKINLHPNLNELLNELLNEYGIDPF